MFYQGYKAGTFVFFGKNPNKVVQYVPPTGNTCWTFTSYGDQTFFDATLETCMSNAAWVGWYPAGKPMSSRGVYNASPKYLNWNDTDGICLLTDGTFVGNTLYACITGYKAEPKRWAAHHNGGDFSNPDLNDAALSNLSITNSAPDKAAAQKSVVSQAKTNGYCYGLNNSGAFEQRAYLAGCKEVYSTMQHDNDPTTKVTLWCPFRGSSKACVKAPF